jgi:hypothetical protein
VKHDRSCGQLAEPEVVVVEQVVEVQVWEGVEERGVEVVRE